MDAIERVEVAVRTALVHDIAMRFGPFGHLDARHFPHASLERHQQFVEDLRKEAAKSTETFVQHFRATYEEFPDLPVWAVCETMTFGSMFTLFKMADRRTRSVIARRYGLHGPVLLSWLQTLNYVRNICAHHARLWNRDLAIRPTIPDEKNDRRWYGTRAISNKKLFVLLTLLQQLLNGIVPQTGWRTRLFNLFDRFPEIPLKAMGMPADWRSHELWT